MNRRAGMHVTSLALLLSAAACGGDPPPAAEKTQAAAPTQEAQPPKAESPMAAARQALTSDLASDTALDTLLNAAEKARKWAGEQRDEKSQGEALMVAAQLELTAIGAAAAKDGAERPTSSGVGAFEDRLRAMSGLPELLGADHADYQAARRVAEAGLVALSTNADVKDVALDLSSARSLALSTTPEGLVIRGVWMARIESALQSLAADPPELQVSKTIPLVGRLLCNRCSDAHHITPEKVTHFLLNPSNSGGMICDTAIQVGRSAKKPPMEIAAMSSCEQLRPEGASEPTLLWGTNAILVGALNLAVELSEAPAGESAISPLIARQSERLKVALQNPIRLPTLLPSAPMADGDAESPWNASMMAIGKGGPSVSAPSDSVFFVGNQDIRAGLRPTVAIHKGKLVSRSAQLGLPAGGKQVMSVEQLHASELNAESGVVPISSALAELRAAIPKIKGEPNQPVELVVDARASAKTVSKLLDALKLAGAHHVRFTKTATHGHTLPLLVRDTPPGLKERFGDSAERPLTAVVSENHVDVWLPRGVKEKKSGELAKFVKGVGDEARVGYRGKAAARIRVPLGTDGHAGLGAVSTKALVKVFSAASRRLNVGPVLHVIAGRGARAADVLGVSSIFQEGSGKALDKPEELWPGTSCGGRAYTRLKRTPKGCSTAVSIAFSKKKSPSNAGISEGPSKAKKDAPKAKKAEAGFCDKKDIAVRMKKRRGSFRFCYERELRMNKDLEGRVAMRFKIGPSGTVTGTPQVTSSTLGSAALHKCLGKNIQKITFAKPDGGNCTVSWPFVFKPK